MSHSKIKSKTIWLIIVILLTLLSWWLWEFIALSIFLSFSKNIASELTSLNSVGSNPEFSKSVQATQNIYFLIYALVGLGYLLIPFLGGVIFSRVFQKIDLKMLLLYASLVTLLGLGFLSVREHYYHAEARNIMNKREISQTALRLQQENYIEKQESLLKSLPVLVVLVFISSYAGGKVSNFIAHR